MKNSLETRLGIFVALAIIAAIVIIEMVGGRNFPARLSRQCRCSTPCRN